MFCVEPRIESGVWSTLPRWARPTTDLIDGIAAAIKSDASLPPNSAGQSLLAASIQKAATELASPVGPTPELAKTISGKSYRLQDNDLHAKTFSLNLVDPNPSWEYMVATERLDRPTVRFAGPIGLDGLFRKASTPYGIDAVKGSWLDDHTFGATNPRARRNAEVDPRFRRQESGRHL